MSGVEKKDCIIVRNARENNLKNININIPLEAFTCVTGPSGCGKSSLIYDTIYAESQRNFLESMSGNMYGQKLMDKPKVDDISNLRPALNVSQKYYNVNPRSTIGTVTDISYYLRTIFALVANEKMNICVDASYFSANNPSSCCTKCNGIGEEYVLSYDKLIPDEAKTLANGGIVYYKGTRTSLEYKLLEAECKYFGIDINKRILDLSNNEREQLLYRKENITFSVRYKTTKGTYKQKNVSRKGVITEINEAIKDIDTPSTFASISKYLTKETCSYCNGSKLREDILSIKVADKNIYQVESMPFCDLVTWLNWLFHEASTLLSVEYVKQLIQDIKRRIDCIIDLKLEYLTLARSIPSLSGGEIQRIRLANQLACSLSGILYILDEPCKGLHYKNIDSIIAASKMLVEKGNTLISIEHNKQYISSSDKIIELGPEGGPKGGYIISEDAEHKNYVYDVRFKNSEYLSEFVSFYGIRHNNLKNIDVKIPYGAITCISGVSGSGKSTLSTVIAECFEKQKPLKCSRTENLQSIKKVLKVNQQPIGKTPRSTVVSYLGIYDVIRDLFANTDTAKKMGLTSSDFSMNVPGGRCEHCQGTGMQKIELTYMPDSYIVCPTCHGKRFNNNVLAVKYKGLNINDVLDLPICNIIDTFDEVKSVRNILQCMLDIGMGYVSLGQMSMNLSGGEAQRIKLAKCLGVKSNGKNIYILDEPTSGLNAKDVELIKDILIKMGKKNETILVIEHNIEFIAAVADYMVDLGNIAGDKGGMTVLQGTPIEVFKDANSSWNGVKIRLSK